MFTGALLCMALVTTGWVDLVAGDDDQQAEVDPEARVLYGRGRSCEKDVKKCKWLQSRYDDLEDDIEEGDCIRHQHVFQAYADLVYIDASAQKLYVSYAFNTKQMLTWFPEGLAGRGSDMGASYFAYKYRRSSFTAIISGDYPNDLPATSPRSVTVEAKDPEWLDRGRQLVFAIKAMDRGVVTSETFIDVSVTLQRDASLRARCTLPRDERVREEKDCAVWSERTEDIALCTTQNCPLCTPSYQFWCTIESQGALQPVQFTDFRGDPNLAAACDTRCASDFNRLCRFEPTRTRQQAPPPAASGLQGDQLSITFLNYCERGLTRADDTVIDKSNPYDPRKKTFCGPGTASKPTVCVLNDVTWSTAYYVDWTNIEPTNPGQCGVTYVEINGIPGDVYTFDISKINGFDVPVKVQYKGAGGTDPPHLQATCADVNCRDAYELCDGTPGYNSNLYCSPNYNVKKGGAFYVEFCTPDKINTVPQTTATPGCCNSLKTVSGTPPFCCTCQPSFCSSSCSNGLGTRITPEQNCQGYWSATKGGPTCQQPCCGALDKSPPGCPFANLPPPVYTNQVCGSGA